MPNSLEGKEGRVNPESSKVDVGLDIEIEEEGQPSTYAWVSKGHKRQKIVNILEKVKDRTL